MDQIPDKHRLVIDTTTLDGFRDGVLFASNFVLANRNDYLERFTVSAPQ